LSFGGYYTTARKYGEVAAFAEQNGLYSIWNTDVQMIDRDVYECLAVSAMKTERIKLGPAITNPLTRHATVTASAIMTLNEISGGRAILGIGPGDGSVRRIGLKPSSVKRLESTIITLRKLLAGEKLVFGDVSDSSMRWTADRIPIAVSATGPNMLRLAGHVSDCVILNVGINDNAIRDGIKRIYEGVSERKEKPQEFSVACFTYFSIGENRQEAINAARPYVIWYIRNAVRLFALAGISIEQFTNQLSSSQRDYLETDFIHADSWSESMERSSFVTDEMVRNFTTAGTPEDAVRLIKDKERLGVEMCIARHTGDEKDWLNFLKLYCESVVPAFK
jgi:5,10-methylenetetrahydromethanopterin reductase